MRTSNLNTSSSSFLLCTAGVFPWSGETLVSSLSKHETYCHGLSVILNWVWIEDDEKGKNARSTDKMIFTDFFVCVCLCI